MTSRTRSSKRERAEEKKAAESSKIEEIPTKKKTRRDAGTVRRSGPPEKIPVAPVGPNNRKKRSPPAIHSPMERSNENWRGHGC